MGGDPRLLDRLATLLEQYAALQHPDRCHLTDVGFNPLDAPRRDQHAAQLAAQFMHLAVAVDLCHLLRATTADLT